MMDRDQLASLVDRYYVAVKDSAENPAPLHALLFGLGVMALNSIALAMTPEGVGTVTPAAETPPVDNSPEEPELQRSSVLWRGRNGQPVDDLETGE